MTFFQILFVLTLNLFSSPLFSDDKSSNLSYFYCASDKACESSEYQAILKKVESSASLLCKADTYVPLYHDTYLLWVCDSMPSFLINIVNFDEDHVDSDFLPILQTKTNCAIDIHSKYNKGEFKPLSVSAEITQTELLGCMVLWHFSHQFTDQSICDDENQILMARMLETLYEITGLLQGSENGELLFEAEKFTEQFLNYFKLIDRQCYWINNSAKRFFNSDWR